MLDIVKSTGEREPFSRGKLCSSLKKAGAATEVANTVCSHVEQKIIPGASTTKVYREALRYLVKNHMEVAARYSLFRGIAELGPAGFLFEQYVEVILQQHGFKTARDIYVEGACISHEIDIIAMRGNSHYLLELKYHNQQGIKTHVPDVMYAYARLEDIVQVENKKEGGKNRHMMWLITNTKFTDTAIKYAKCKGIRLSGWNNMSGEADFSLETMIVSKGLYPVTVLPSMNSQLLAELAQRKIILAQDLIPYEVKDLVKLGISELVAKRLVVEVSGLFKS